MTSVVPEKRDIDPVAWPMDRETAEDDGWRPPTGTRVVSVDDHGMEEMHLWENRLKGADKLRAPKLWVDEDKRFHMEVEGASYDVPGLDSLLGEGRQGMWDRDERLKDMDSEGIDTSLFFHSRAMSLVRMEDKEFFARCMTVYNEWLAEYCAVAPDRLVGVGILPTLYQPEATRDYLQMMQDLGIRALEIPSAPKNVPYNSSKMEPMWEAIAESGIPVMFHIGAYLEFRGKGATGANLTKNLGPYRPLWSLLAFSGILERNPDLNVVFLEGGFGWVPWTLQDADWVYRTYESQLKPKLAELPSYYFKRQCYAAMMSDDVGLKLARDYDMADNLLWSCDYPHAEGIFGSSRSEIRKIFNVLGDEDGKKVVGGTAERLWNLPPLGKLTGVVVLSDSAHGPIDQVDGPASMKVIDPRAMRDAMSSFATGVAVVTASGLDGEPVGLTVNSFNSVSLEPPLVLWSLALTSRRLPAFRQAKYWGVHILAADQEQVSNRFASSSKNRFDDLAYHLSAEGVPLIEGCAARFVCRTTFEYEGGDHAIFVGEVLDLESAVSPPLIFHGGQYRRVLSVPPREVPARLDNDGEFGRYFIGHTLGRVYSDAFRELRQECSVRGLSGRDYTVLVSLGLGDGCDIESLQRRAARGGARLSVDAVDDMARRGIVDIDAGLVRLTTQGNRLLSEIIAVSQASHFRLQDKLAPEEFSTLEHLLDKLAPDA